MKRALKNTQWLNPFQNCTNICGNENNDDNHNNNEINKKENDGRAILKREKKYTKQRYHKLNSFLYIQCLIGPSSRLSYSSIYSIELSLITIRISFITLHLLNCPSSSHSNFLDNINFRV